MILNNYRRVSVSVVDHLPSTMDCIFPKAYSTAFVSTLKAVFSGVDLGLFCQDLSTLGIICTNADEVAQNMRDYEALDAGLQVQFNRMPCGDFMDKQVAILAGFQPEKDDSSCVGQYQIVVVQPHLYQDQSELSYCVSESSVEDYLQQTHDEPGPKLPLLKINAYVRPQPSHIGGHYLDISVIAMDQQLRGTGLMGMLVRNIAVHTQSDFYTSKGLAVSTIFAEPLSTFTALYFDNPLAGFVLGDQDATLEHVKDLGVDHQLKYFPERKKALVEQKVLGGAAAGYCDPRQVYYEIDDVEVNLNDWLFAAKFKADYFSEGDSRAIPEKRSRKGV